MLLLGVLLIILFGAFVASWAWLIHVSKTLFDSNKGTSFTKTGKAALNVSIPTSYVYTNSQEMWMKMPGITVSGPYLDRLTQPSQIDWNNPSGVDNQIVTWGQNQNAVAVLANVAQGYVCPIDCTFGPIQTDSSGEFVLYVNMYENTSASSASCFTSMFGNLLNTPGMCNGESVFQACFQNGNGPICQMIQGKNSSLTDECISALQTYSTTLQGKTLSETFNYAQGTYAPGWMLQACNTNTQNSYPISTNLLTSSGLSNYTYPYGDPCSSGGGNSTAQNVIYDVLDILSAIVF